MLARDDGDLFWHAAKVLARDPHGQLLVQWEDRAGAGTLSASSSPPPARKATISERYAVLLGVPAKPSELRHGRRAVALWTDGQGYLCELLGNSSRGRVSLQFEDGLQYDAPAEDVMIPLEEPLFPSLGTIKASAPCVLAAPHSPLPPAASPPRTRPSAWHVRCAALLLPQSSFKVASPL